nr:xylulose kinase-1 [Tanacetum cinerariifolium]
MKGKCLSSYKSSFGKGQVVLDFENYAVRILSAERDIRKPALLNDESWLGLNVVTESYHDDSYNNLFRQTGSVDTQGALNLLFLRRDMRKLMEKYIIVLRYVVPTDRVIVPTGRYVVPTGRVIVATGRVLSHGQSQIVIPGQELKEHITVQRESKARTSLLQSIPDDHVADFHYMDDAMDIWNAVKARFGGNAESKKMKKSMLKQEFLEFKTGVAGEFALMGVTSERNSSKNLFRLIDSSMSVRTKVGLGFINCISKNELGWDDSAFSVFTTNSEDMKGRPVFHRFAKTDSMKVVPPPLSGDYTSLSNHIDLDESQMSYGTKSLTYCDSKSVSNNFVSCDDSDKSSEVNTNDFASSVSSVKSSEHQPNDSTSCASTSSFVPQAILLRTGKVNIPPVRPQPVPTGKPKVSAPVPTGKPKVFTPVTTGKPKVSTPVPTSRPNRPSPFPTDRGFSISNFCPQQVVLGKHIENVYTGYPRTIVDLIHLHTDDNVVDLLTKAFDGPRLFKSTHVAAVVPNSVVGSRFPKDSSILLPFGVQYCWFEFRHADAAFYKDIMLICADFSNILFKNQSLRYVVSTGRVIVPTGRYVVPTGRVIVATGKTNEFGDWVKLSHPKQAHRGRHPMLIEFLDFEDLCKDFVLQSSLPQLHLGIIYPNLID